jgi:hypothetical protein
MLLLLLQLVVLLRKLALLGRPLLAVRVLWAAIKLTRVAAAAAVELLPYHHPLACSWVVA